MYDQNFEVCESADDGDYGFAFNNRLVEKVLQWHPQIRFAERVPIILDNIKNGRRAI
jgi:hypothetical protein